MSVYKSLASIVRSTINFSYALVINKKVNNNIYADDPLIAEKRELKFTMPTSVFMTVSSALLIGSHILGIDNSLTDIIETTYMVSNGMMTLYDIYTAGAMYGYYRQFRNKKDKNVLMWDISLVVLDAIALSYFI